MWYTNSEKSDLDYNKPICAVRKESGEEYLLMPINHGLSYDFRGFDWFNIKTGEFNSCRGWKSAEDAVEAYINDYKISNCTINLHKAGVIINAKN